MCIVCRALLGGLADVLGSHSIFSLGISLGIRPHGTVATVSILTLGGWSPVGRMAGLLNVGVEHINFFKCEALGFVDKEVHKGNADEARPEPYEKDL